MHEDRLTDAKDTEPAEFVRYLIVPSKPKVQLTSASATVEAGVVLPMDAPKVRLIQQANVALTEAASVARYPAAPILHEGQLQTVRGMEAVSVAVK